MRLGVAQLPIRLDLPLYDDVNLGGAVWYIDYDGEVCENVKGLSRKICSLPCGPLGHGDIIGFLLDAVEGTLRIFHNGKDQGMCIGGLDAFLPLHPIFSLDNQDEQLRLLRSYQAG